VSAGSDFIPPTGSRYRKVALLTEDVPSNGNYFFRAVASQHNETKAQR